MRLPDFYKVLGISDKATPDEIKAAFRRLTLKYHPDRNPGDKEAVEIFSIIHTAYGTLSDPNKRKEYDSKRQRPSMAIPGMPMTTIVDRNKIRITVNKRVIILGEHIQVLIAIYEKNNKIIVSGLHRFDVADGPVINSLLPPGPDTPELELAYVLKAKATGYLEIGPASFISNGRKYLSDSVYIKVNPPADLVRIRPASRFEKIQSAIVSTLIVFYLILIGYNIYQFKLLPFIGVNNTSYNNPTHLTLSDISLATGDSPYDKFYGKGKYDISALNQIVFKNGKHYDAVVLLTDLKSNDPIRNNYVRAGEDYTMNYIPDGKYYLKVVFGNDWNDTLLVLKNENVIGGFNRNLHYEVFSQQINILQMHHSRSGDTLNYMLYKITFYPVQDGNTESVAVEKHEFFN